MRHIQLISGNHLFSGGIMTDYLIVDTIISLSTASQLFKEDFATFAFFFRDDQMKKNLYILLTYFMFCDIS